MKKITHFNIVLVIRAMLMPNIPINSPNTKIPTLINNRLKIFPNNT